MIVLILLQIRHGWWGEKMQDNVYVAIINRKCIFILSPVAKAEPLMSELIDTTVFHNLAPGPV